MFHHFSINCIWLILFLHELNKFWYWSNSLASSIETFLSNRYYSPDLKFSYSVVCNRRIYPKHSSIKVDHLSRYATQGLHNTDTSDMHKSQSRSLPSLEFSQCWFNLVWYVHLIISWIVAFTVARHDTTSTIDAFDFSIFWNFSLKTATDDCKCLKVRSDTFQKHVSEQQLVCQWTLSMDVMLGTFEASLASWDKLQRGHFGRWCDVQRQGDKFEVINNVLI